MKTLKVEREAIVREVFEKTEDIDIDVRYNGLEHSVACYAFRDVVRTALISHEEKVMERVIGQQIIKEFIEATPHWHDELIEKDIPCIMCGIIPNNILKVAKALTLPITDENI